MPAPYDYSVDVQSPAEALLKGLKLGSAFADVAARREAEQFKMQQQQSLANAMGTLSDKIKSGTATEADFGQFALLAPKDQAEASQKVWESMSKERQQGMLSFGSQVMAALGSQNPQIGIDLLNERAQAERNKGNEDQAKAYETYSKLAALDPAGAVAVVGGLVGPLPGGDKVIESYVKIEQERRAQQLAPSQLTESQAKAKTAAAKAKFAESEAALDLQKKGWDITKIQEDIKIAKQNSSIAALNAQIAKEGNVLKRQELGMKLQEMTEKRDTSVREKAADLESARANVDNMLNTAQRIISTPKSIIDAAAGPISARVLTLSQDTADFEELVNTLGSQAFLAQIPNIKGMGALSNAEGEKLTAALQNFSLRQSPERLVENVKEATRLLNKARQNMTARSGLPESAPDIPSAPRQNVVVDY